MELLFRLWFRFIGRGAGAGRRFAGLVQAPAHL